MKKIFQLVMIFLTVSGLLSVNAQVRIGSDDDPHSGAILDLSNANSLGLLLPRVSLSDVSVWSLAGSSTDGTGMVVYNTNNSIIGGNGSGIYIWDGSAWSPLVKPALPAEVKVTGFDVTPSGTDIDILRGSSQNFTASNFQPSDASQKGVSWALGTGGYAQIISSNETACTVEGLSVGDVVLDMVSLDGNFSRLVNIHVKACTSKPAVPAGISFSKTSGIKLNENITATATPEVTSGGAVPTKYNWTVPAANFDIVSGGNERTITLKAKAAATSITTAIKVNAENTCGTSVDYSNTTAINILDCSVAPAQPGAITISPTTVSAGGNFTASISPVSGATGYAWNVPSGLTVVSGQNTASITYHTSSSGTVAAGAITVYASNDCGNGAARASSDAVTVLNPGDYGTPDGASGAGNTTQELVFKSQAELLALAENTDQTVILNAYIEYSDDTKVQLSKTVKIQNKVCCPGYLIENGAFTGTIPNSINSGLSVDATLARFSSATRQDLCVGPDFGDYRTWNSVIGSFCNTNVHGEGGDWNDGNNDWRLPNIAELANMHAIKGSIPGLATSGGYWSITNEAFGNYLYAAYWNFTDSGTASFGSKQNHLIGVYTRCVRTIN